MMNTEEFWNQLGTYNATTWPIQIVWLAVAIILTYLVFTRRNARVNMSMKILLSFAFAWNGVVFFLVFTDGPVYDFFFAPLFIIIAILFAVDIFAKHIEFRLPEGWWRRYATLFWVLMWLIYPFVGMALGRGFPRVCTPMNACPSTVFAISLIVAAIPKVDKKVYIMLLPWALMGLPKCLGIYQCYEDCILFVAGVYGLVMLIANWRAINQKFAS
jgi:hypothetical protein